jgi:hypothetical protein
MLDFLTKTDDFDAISLLKKDHIKVKGLFDQFEKADNLREKRKIVAEAIMELKLHAAVEEEIFYPAVRKPIGKKVMNEADEEHHVAKVLIAELEEMDGKEDHYDAKFTVLSENVRHHIKEEENDMLPKARALHIDMDALGKHILIRKAQLKKRGVATFAEERVVAKSKGRGDSPAQAANRKKSPKVRMKAVKSAAFLRPNNQSKKSAGGQNNKALHKKVRA